MNAGDSLNKTLKGASTPTPGPSIDHLINIPSAVRNKFSRRSTYETSVGNNEMNRDMIHTSNIFTANDGNKVEGLDPPVRHKKRMYSEDFPASFENVITSSTASTAGYTMTGTLSHF